MSGIKRYSWSTDMMEKWDDGDYVLHSDHEAEVARLRAELEKVRGYEVAPLEAKVAELLAEVEKYREDAERYRWVRDPSSKVAKGAVGITLDYANKCYFLSEADAAIDAAMGASA